MKVRDKETGEVFEVTKRVTYMRNDDSGYGFFESSVEVLEDEINWEQKRYEIAKELFIHFVEKYIVVWEDEYKAEKAVKLADTFIDELKKK